MPLVDLLQANAIPLQAASRMEQEGHYTQRRKLLHAILAYAGWSWQDLNQPKGIRQGMDFLYTPD